MRTLTRLASGALAYLAFAAPVLAQGFGSGIAIDADQVLISEPGGPTSTGAVLVYEKGPDGWAESARIRPSGAENGARFGTWLSISGDRMVVGSPGRAYLFERANGRWTQSGILEAGLVPEALTFGTSGALAGDVALIAAGGGGFRGPGAPGRVYAFERTDAGWTQAGELTPSASGAGDRFGAAIITNGGVAAVGAPGAEANGLNGAGAVYFFQRGEDGAWTEAGESLSAPDPIQSAGFGGAMYVVPSDDAVMLTVSAPNAAGVGSAYAFSLTPDGWTLRNRFFPPVVGVGRRRGLTTSFAMAGEELWIGASGIGTRGEGLVLRYGPTGDGGLTLSKVLGASNASAGDGFGGRMAVGDRVAAIVAGGKDYRSGTVYIFERQGEDWVETDEVWTEPQNYAAVNGHEVGCESGVAADFDCSDVNILSFMPVRSLGAGRGVRLNDVWGWTDPQTDHEYALVGLTDQASFVDITDANNPRYVGRLPMTEGANGSVWRDIKVYKNHAFIVSDGAGKHGVQVFDLTRLRDVGDEPVTFDVDALYEGIASAHNIVINEETGFAYAVGSSGGGETCGGGLHMIDIHEPTHPVFAGCFADETTGRRKTGYSHDALCVNYHGPDAEHVGEEICFGSNEDAVSIADVSDKEHPVALSTATYPNVGYTHQGWVTEDQRYFYLGDELDELQNDFEGTRTLIFDISDLDDPVLVSEHFGESTASDHNMYVVGDLLYQSNYNSGLRILDVSDPEDPTEVGFIDTVPYAEGPAMGGSWSNYPYFPSGTIIVTSGNEGLFMVKYQKPLVP